MPSTLDLYFGDCRTGFAEGSIDGRAVTRAMMAMNGGPALQSP